MMKKGIAGGEEVAAFDTIFKDVNGNVQHNAYDADVANSFYNLASDFYECVKLLSMCLPRMLSSVY